MEIDAKGRENTTTNLSREFDEFGCAAASVVNQRQSVGGGDADTPPPQALFKTRSLDEPAGRELEVPAFDFEGGHRFVIGQ